VKKFRNYYSNPSNANQYFLGVTQGLQKLIDFQKEPPKVDIVSHWTQACEEIGKDNIDWKKVVEVIHGHTWCAKEFKHKSPPITKSFPLDERVLNSLKETEKKVMKYLNIV